MNISSTGAWLCAATLIGCAHASGTKEAPGDFAPGDFEAFSCPSEGASGDEVAESERRARGAALSLAMPVDHVRFVQYHPGEGRDMFATRGAGCDEASDPPGCEAKLDAMEAEAQSNASTCSGPDCAPFVYAISIDRDQLTLHRTADAVLALLGTIESPEEAWIVLMVQQGAPAHRCQNSESSAYRRLPNGFELMRHTYNSSCLEVVDHVDPSGQLKRVRETVIEREAEACN